MKSYSKYRNKKTNGYDSVREANRAMELQLLEKAGIISELRMQVKFEVIPKQDGERAAHYIADFVYLDKNGVLVVEDAKGIRTPQYILKRKLMLFVHKIPIKEV